MRRPNPSLAVLRYDIFTDGSCHNKGGLNPGGWALVLLEREPEAWGRFTHEEGDRIAGEASGGSKATTSNAMELRAISCALNRLPLAPCHAVLYTDSSYAKDCLTHHVHLWRKRGWITALGKPVVNRRLLEYIFLRLRRLADQGCRVEIRKVPGHRYHWNEYVDKLAGLARRAIAAGGAES